MTHAKLIKELARELREALQSVRMPLEYAGEPEKFTPINVFEQYLPRDLFEVTTYYPLVMVELMSIEEDLREGTRAEVGITIGVYGKEEDGWQDGFHLLEICRERLLERQVLAKKFRLLSLRWSLPEEEPLPFFFLTGTAEYRTR